MDMGLWKEPALVSPPPSFPLIAAAIVRSCSACISSAGLGYPDSVSRKPLRRGSRCFAVQCRPWGLEQCFHPPFKVLLCFRPFCVFGLLHIWPNLDFLL